MIYFIYDGQKRPKPAGSMEGAGLIDSAGWIGRNSDRRKKYQYFRVEDKPQLLCFGTALVLVLVLALVLVLVLVVDLVLALICGRNVTKPNLDLEGPRAVGGPGTHLETSRSCCPCLENDGVDTSLLGQGQSVRTNDRVQMRPTEPGEPGASGSAPRGLFSHRRPPVGLAGWVLQPGLVLIPSLIELNIWLSVKVT